MPHLISRFKTVGWKGREAGRGLSKAEGPNSRFSVTRDARAKVPVTVPGHLDYQIIASLAALSHRANQPAQGNSLSFLPVIDLIVLIVDWTESDSVTRISCVTRGTAQDLKFSPLIHCSSNTYCTAADSDMYRMEAADTLIDSELGHLYPLPVAWELSHSCC